VIQPPFHCKRKRRLAKNCHPAYRRAMTTMNISLPETLRAFVDD
jgi:hypothetical protein